jgi:hypothetical protein
MRLYHRQFQVILVMAILTVSLLLFGCNAPSRQPSLISIDLTADGKTTPVQVPPNSTVQDVLTRLKPAWGWAASSHSLYRAAQRGVVRDTYARIRRHE